VPVRLGSLSSFAVRPLVRGNVLAVGAMVMWAAGFPAAEVLLETWPPIALIVVRLGLALMIMVPLWIWLEGRQSVNNGEWGHAMLVGGLGFGYGTYLLLVAQWLTDPITVALVAACTPIAATVVEMAYGHRRLNLNFVLGLAATVTGGIVALGGFDMPQLGAGVICAIAAGLLFSWGSYAAVQDFPRLSPLGSSTVVTVGAFVMVNLLYVVHGLAGLEVAPTSNVDLAQLGLLAVYALAGMALSQILLIASVARLGVAVATFHVNMLPFYVMVLLLMLGGSWTWAPAIGATIVALGVIVSQKEHLRPGG